MPVELQAALIGAGVALIGFLLRDFLLKLWQERREGHQSTMAVFQRYGEPLAAAAASLLWRLHEVFHVPGRGEFLRGEGPTTRLDEYKAISTPYRLACLLGWIRAFRRELAMLKVDSKESLQNLDKAITSFESALADGPHVELTMLNGLADLWALQLPGDMDERQSTGTALDQCLKRTLREARVTLATELSDDDQKRGLCKALATEVCKRLHLNVPNQEVLTETCARAIQQVSIREAWLYRDWQQAIGDLMVVSTNGAERRFDIIGFGRFEDLWLGETPKVPRQLRRLAEVFERLDVSGADQYDARVGQLRRTLMTTAALIVALAGVKTRHRLVTSETLELARKVIRLHPDLAPTECSATNDREDEGD